MATATWYVNKDAVTADNGTSLGAGAGDYLSIGNYAGYDYRTFMAFAYSFTGFVTVTSAVLHCKTSSQVKVAFGSDPDLYIQRLSSSWSEGTAATLSSTNAIERSNEPGVTGTRYSWDVSTVENTWDTVTITAIVQEAFAANQFYGLRLIAQTTSTTDVTEFYSREYGTNDAYIVVTYTTNTLPSAPTQTSPTAGATAQSLTPSIVFSHVDAEADACALYDLQVSTDSSFVSVTHWNTANQTSGIVGNVVTRTYAGTALANNTTYYWRARTSDAVGFGAWSAARSFVTAKLPTATLTEPTTDATRLAKLTFTAGAGWSSPRLNVSWSFGCGDGGTQSSYQVYIESATTSGGVYSLWQDTGTVSGTATSLVSTTTVVNGSFYKVKVRVTCTHGQTAAYTATVRAKASWSVILTRVDLTTAPTSSWSVGSIVTSGTSGTALVTLEYGSNSTSATPGTFYSTMSSVALNRYWFLRTYLLAYGASPVTFPSLLNLTLTYSSLVLAPDHWTRVDTTNQTVDTGSSIAPGGKSIKIAGTGSTQAVYQIVEVQPNTDYVLSGLYKGTGNSGAFLATSSSSPTGAFGNGGATPVLIATADWTRVRSTTWNSGSRTSVYILCRMGGAAGTTAWFDDVKFEASTVATPYSPGSSQDAAVVEGGGVTVDGVYGGVFRLRGSTGGVGDTVELDAHGLLFGGDANLYRSAANNLATDDQFVIKYVGAGANQLQITDTTAGAGLIIGADTNLFRYSAGQLRTGGDLDIVGTLLFGTGADTNLYRASANALKTDDSLEVAARFVCGEQAIKVKAGVPSDADFGVDASGNLCLDTTNNRIYFRVGTTWKYAALV